MAKQKHWWIDRWFTPPFFRHPNFQRWSENGVLFRILTSKCAWHHSSVQFFQTSEKVVRNLQGINNFFLKNVLRTTAACHLSFLIWPQGSAPAALASLLLEPPDPQICPTFRARVFYFFWVYIFSLLLSSLLLFFSLCLFLHLLFISPYCRKFDC